MNTWALAQQALRNNSYLQFLAALLTASAAFSFGASAEIGEHFVLLVDQGKTFIYFLFFLFGTFLFVRMSLQFISGVWKASSANTRAFFFYGIVAKFVPWRLKRKLYRFLLGRWGNIFAAALALILASPIIIAPFIFLLIKISAEYRRFSALSSSSSIIYIAVMFGIAALLFFVSRAPGRDRKRDSLISGGLRKASVSFMGVAVLASSLLSGQIFMQYVKEYGPKTSVSLVDGAMLEGVILGSGSGGIVLYDRVNKESRFFNLQNISRIEAMRPATPVQ